MTPVRVSRSMGIVWIASELDAKNQDLASKIPVKLQSAPGVGRPDSLQAYWKSRKVKDREMLVTRLTVDSTGWQCLFGSEFCTGLQGFGFIEVNEMPGRLLKGFAFPAPQGAVKFDFRPAPL